MKALGSVTYAAGRAQHSKGCRSAFVSQRLFGGPGHQGQKTTRFLKHVCVWGRGTPGLQKKTWLKKHRHHHHHQLLRRLLFCLGCPPPGGGSGRPFPFLNRQCWTGVGPDLGGNVLLNSVLKEQWVTSTCHHSAPFVDLS